MSVDTQRYRALFLTEARKTLAQSERLAASDVDLRENAFALFRNFHTLKSMAATMGVAPMVSTAHALEEVFFQAKQGLAELDDRARLLLTDGLETLGRQMSDYELDGEASEAAWLEARIHEFLRSESEKGFALISPEREEPAAEPEAPIGLEMDGALAAMGELFAAAARLRELAPEHGGLVGEVARVEAATRAIYDELVRLRQVPFDTVVPWLRRHVRRIAQDRGLTVALEVHGSEVEVDQRVLGALQPVLIHLVQNAIAHGIEAPDERRAAGKPATGRVSLTAERIGQHLHVVVQDDGRGLDLDALRRAARATDGDAVDLALRPGVSTAARVDEVAGRGIGMGVVQGGVERLGGHLSVDSTPGEGAQFTFDVPIHAELVPLAIVEAAGALYALRGARVAPTSIPGSPALFGLPVLGATTVRTADGRAVRVDRVLGATESLVNPPPFPLNRVSRIVGTTIAPDGRVVCVFDP